MHIRQLALWKIKQCNNPNFIDYEEAFDKVQRDKLIDILKGSSTHEKDIC